MALRSLLLDWVIEAASMPLLAFGCLGFSRLLLVMASVVTGRAAGLVARLRLLSSLPEAFPFHLGGNRLPALSLSLWCATTPVAVSESTGFGVGSDDVCRKHARGAVLSRPRFYATIPDRLATRPWLSLAASIAFAKTFLLKPHKSLWK